MCQNISKRHAAVSEEVVSAFFENLKTTLEGVPPANIVNYDETSVVDEAVADLSTWHKTCRENHEFLKKCNINHVCCHRMVLTLILM